jgi:hypothetical protein
MLLEDDPDKIPEGLTPLTEAEIEKAMRSFLSGDDPAPTADSEPADLFDYTDQTIHDWLDEVTKDAAKDAK